MPMNRKELGKAIKAARAKARMTQEMVAERGGLSLTAIKHLESGRRYPSVPSLLRLAKALNTTAGQLLADTEQSDDATKAAIMYRLNLCSPHNLSIALALIEALLEHNR